MKFFIFFAGIWFTLSIPSFAESPQEDFNQGTCRFDGTGQKPINVDEILAEVERSRALCIKIDWKKRHQKIFHLKGLELQCFGEDGEYYEIVSGAIYRKPANYGAERNILLVGIDILEKPVHRMPVLQGRTCTLGEPLKPSN